MFLTRDDLVVLTGYVKPSMQVRWLQARGIPHEVNRLGRPAVPQDWRKTVVSEPEMGPVP